MSRPDFIFDAGEYPGRFLVLGRTSSGWDAFIYGITGRSDSSRARRLREVNENYDDEFGRVIQRVIRFIAPQKRRRIDVEPTDPEILNKGNPDLLIYSAVIEGIYSENITVGNGKQTLDVSNSLSLNDPLIALINGHSGYSFEPDKPNYTPRITGCIKNGIAAIGITKKYNIGDKYIVPKSQFFDIPLANGRGMFISTYKGMNIEPLPSFSGEPIEIDIPGQYAEDIAKNFYEGLFLGEGKPDNRVSVAAGVLNKAKGKYNFGIVNKADRHIKA